MNNLRRSRLIGIGVATVAVAGSLAFALPASAHTTSTHHASKHHSTKINAKKANRKAHASSSSGSPLPSKPYDLTATPGNTQVVLNWSASNGHGSTITGYSVQISTDSGTTWTTLSDPNTTTTYTATGLTNATSYLFRVAGEDSAGTGAYAMVIASPVAISVTAPSSATIEQGSVHGTAYAFLSWAAPQTPANPVTGYTVEVSTDGGTTWTVVAANIAGTAIAVPTQSGASYEVAAESTSGLSDFASFVAPSNSSWGNGGDNDQGGHR